MLPQVTVRADRAGEQELAVSPDLDDLARLDHDDPVQVGYRRQPVGNHQSSRAGHQPPQRFLDVTFGL